MWIAPLQGSPEFWLNAQRAVDLWDAAEAVGDEVERISPLSVPEAQQATEGTATER